METVDWETPVYSAISLVVTLFLLPICIPLFFRNNRQISFRELPSEHHLLPVAAVKDYVLIYFD
jgi:hypothetical protein